MKNQVNSLIFTIYCCFSATSRRRDWQRAEAGSFVKGKSWVSRLTWTIYLRRRKGGGTFPPPALRPPQPLQALLCPSRIQGVYLILRRTYYAAHRGKVLERTDEESCSVAAAGEKSGNYFKTKLNWLRNTYNHCWILLLCPCFCVLKLKKCTWNGNIITTKGKLKKQIFRPPPQSTQNTF